MRLLVAIAVVLLAGCRKPEAPAPVAPVQPVTTQGESAGVRFLEHMTGGARPDERVPMIIALHPMGGDPTGLLEMLGRYDRRARLILPYGHPRGGMYFWFDSAHEDIAAPVVMQEVDRLANAIRLWSPRGPPWVSRSSPASRRAAS